MGIKFLSIVFVASHLVNPYTEKKDSFTFHSIYFSFLISVLCSNKKKSNSAKIHLGSWKSVKTKKLNYSQELDTESSWKPSLHSTMFTSVALVLHIWPLAFLLMLLVLKCRNVKPIFTTHYHLYRSLSTPHPPNWASMALNPNNNQPPSLPHMLNPTLTPRRFQHRWIVFCASKIPDIPHAKKWQSPLIFNQYSAIITSVITQPAKPILNKPVHHPSTSITSTIHIKTFMTPTHKCKIPPYQHINSLLSSPMPQSTPTHSHPNPHQATNSELVWPLSSPPAHPWPTQLAETMATG